MACCHKVLYMLTVKLKINGQEIRHAMLAIHTWMMSSRITFHTCMVKVWNCE